MASPTSGISLCKRRCRKKTVFIRKVSGSKGIGVYDICCERPESKSDGKSEAEIEKTMIKSEELNEQNPVKTYCTENAWTCTPAGTAWVTDNVVETTTIP